MYFGFLVIFICALVFDCNALNCRTDGGPREDKLKSVFMSCAKKLDGMAPSNDSSGGYERNQGYQGGRRDQQDYDERAMKNSNRRNDNNMMRNDGSPMGEEVASEYPKYNTYRSTTSSPSPRRMRRQQPRDTRRNSGHRSQYNPNTSEHPMMEGSYGRERNGSDNATGMSEKNKGCIIHCFLQDLEMTGDNGMPDRYMVTHVITKDVKNEDLKDFLQESIEECFQILYNENNQDKCEFSKNLMMCLSEKGRSNCDDWKEDTLHF